MSVSSAASWSLRLGRWHGVEVRLHIYLPLLALVVLWLSSLPGVLSERLMLQGRPIPAESALVGLVVLVASVILHEAARAGVAYRIGGRTNLIVIGPFGGWAQPQLPSDPPAHLITAMSGPLTYLALLVIGACILGITGERNILQLLSPFAPEFIRTDSMLQLTAQLMVWVNAWLLMINLLPIQPCDGAEILRGLLWPMVGQASASAAMAHIAYGSATVTAIMAVLVQRQPLNDFLPGWFPLAVLSVLLLYGGNRGARQRQYDVGIAIDEFENDEEIWIPADAEEERAAVLAEQLQEKQQEALDRKRREREDREDARVDDILARLQHIRFDELSDEEQAVLKRASRRYRQRRQHGV